MKIIISTEKTVGDINRDFQKYFQCLKLKFVRYPHGPGQPSLLDPGFSSHTRLGNISPRMKPGLIEIEPSLKVSDLEKIFQKQFGLPVQVYRKFHDNWIETAQTDHFTLEKQNSICRTVFHSDYNMHRLYL